MNVQEHSLDLEHDPKIIIPVQYHSLLGKIQEVHAKGKIVRFSVTNLIERRGSVPTVSSEEKLSSGGPNDLVVRANAAPPLTTLRKKLEEKFDDFTRKQTVFSTQTLVIFNAHGLGLADFHDIIHFGCLKHDCNEIVFESCISPLTSPSEFHWAAAGMAIFADQVRALYVSDDETPPLRIKGSVDGDCLDLTKIHLNTAEGDENPCEIRCIAPPGEDFFRTLQALGAPLASNVDAKKVLVAIAGGVDDTDEAEDHRRRMFCE